MMRGIRVTALAWCALTSVSHAQLQPSPRKGLPAVTDSVRMLDGTPLTFDTFLAGVTRNHPVVRQARLIATGADGDVTAAFGNFEPKLEASWQQKRFASSLSSAQTLYWNYADIALKIPTPFGADFKLGYERASGRYTNPQFTTPSNGLYTAGLSVPLGQRLITDERRTALRVARALRTVAEAERSAITNKLLFSAAKSYAEWYSSAMQLQVMRDGVRLAGQRYTAIARRVVAGDAAGIDSIEAAAELNRRRAQLQGAEQAYFAATLDLTSYVWDERVQPVDLAPAMVPSDSGLGSVVLDSTAVPALLARVMARHPDVRKAEGKLAQAAAERSLARQAMIPLVSADLFALRGRGDGFDVSDAIARDGNYKGAISVSSPLLFFKERGKFQSTDARLDRAELEAREARRDVVLLVRTAINDLAQYDAQLALQRDAVRLFRILSAGERAKFESGESTLFLVNARERQVLDEEMKQIALQAKRLAARAALAVAAGAPGRLPELR